MPDSDRRKLVFRLFGYGNPCAKATLIGVVGVFLTPIAGCASGEKDDDGLAPYAEQSEAVLSPIAGAGDAAAKPGRGWSVLIAVVPTNRQSDADQMLATVQASGLGDAYLADRSGRAAVVLGSFDDPGSEMAQAALTRVRETEIGGVAPFAAAILIPPPAGQAQSTGNENDLRTVHARLGDRAVYTLQVAVYGRGDFEKPTEEDLRAFRAQAELAVAEMRSEGDEAYFYHGPNSSSVTVGVFDHDDHDGSTVPPVESARLRQLRKKYPNNLLNGEGLMETVRTERGPVKRLQASRLVAIPKK